MVNNQGSNKVAEHRFNDVFSSLPTTIFETMSRLASEHKSINLGQGFPDRELEGPSSMKDEVARSMREESNQYPPLMGVPSLREAIADHVQPAFSHCDNITAENVLVTLGATEALASSFLGLLNPGDEVIVFAPMYDSYIPMIRRAGAIPVVINLCPPRWNFDPTTLQNAFTPRTKLIVVNTPHNPTGKVFSLEEINFIADVMKSFPNVIALLDEVYTSHVYPGSMHVSLSNVANVVDRCVCIGSAGKTFSFTDFKVGWAVSSSLELLHAVAKAHQFLTFTVNSALQRAVAYGLDHETEFYSSLGGVFEKKRDYLTERLMQVGFTVLPAEGTYFLIADFAPLLPRLRNPEKYSNDVEFCTELTINPGVTLIPVSAFYENREEAPKTLVRFVLCKTDEKLKAACDALEKFFTR